MLLKQIVLQYICTCSKGIMLVLLWYNIGYGWVYKKMWNGIRKEFLSDKKTVHTSKILFTTDKYSWF